MRANLILFIQVIVAMARVCGHGGICSSQTTTVDSEPLPVSCSQSPGKRSLPRAFAGYSALPGYFRTGYDPL
jgi:hypothetical protein